MLAVIMQSSCLLACCRPLKCLKRFLPQRKARAQPRWAMSLERITAIMAAAALRTCLAPALRTGPAGSKGLCLALPQCCLWSGSHSLLLVAGSQGSPSDSWRGARPHCCSGGWQALWNLPVIMCAAAAQFGTWAASTPEDRTCKLRGPLFGLTTVLLLVILQSCVNACCRLLRQHKWSLTLFRAPLQLRWDASLDGSETHSCSTTDC